MSRNQEYDVVIPARNEQATIGHIVRVLLNHRHIGKVYVMVDDDTIDDTEGKAEHAGAVVTRLSNITGKGQLLKWGCTLVSTERTIFCDADYTGFNGYAVRLVSSPMAEGTQRIIVPKYPTLGQWQRTALGKADIAFSQITWGWVSGFRSFPTHMVAGVDLHGYLAETQLNMAARSLGIKTEFLYTPSLIAPLRFTDQRMEEMERDRKWGLANHVFHPLPEYNRDDQGQNQSVQSSTSTESLQPQNGE